MKSFESTLLISQKAVLGEGPIWDAQSQTLYYVDIEQKKILNFDPASKQLAEQTVKNRVGCIAPAANGGLTAGVTNAVEVLSKDGKTCRTAISVKLPDGIRFNDGKCDAKGRMWVGTMAVDQSAEYAKDCGCLYCLEMGHEPKKVLSGMGIPNGLAWTKDNQLFYHIDTPTGAVFEYPFDLENGTLGNGRPVIQIPKEEGSPDGMCIDENNNLWIALWGGRKVVCCNPKTGERLAEIPVPAENVSCCCFGGEQMDELFITTAMNEMGEGGEVYHAKVDAKGPQPFAFQE